MRAILMAIVGAGLLLSIQGVGPARALEPGQCGTPQEISATLGEEGHGFIARMNTLVADTDIQDTRFLAEFVTANADRSEWYIVTGNQDLNTASTQFCVTLKGRDLEVVDFREPPAELQLIASQWHFDRTKALAQCERIQGRIPGVACNAYEDVLLNLTTEFGEQTALRGMTLDASGNDLTLATIAASSENGTYRSLSTASEGATTIISSGQNFAFAPSVLQELDRQ